MTRRAASLPHAYPFRFIDTVLVERNADFSRGTARARVTIGGNASATGVWGSAALLAEAIAQSALLLEGGDPEAARTGRLAGIEGLEIARRPEPGDTLEIDVRLVRVFGTIAKFEGVVRAGAETIARGSVLVSRASSPFTV